MFILSASSGEHCRQETFGRPCKKAVGTGDKIKNLFPEGIQLGSIAISIDIFRIPEGMRPYSISVNMPLASYSIPKFCNILEYSSINDFF